ncbi:DMT family transporter [Nitratireductor rhodophyticola]|uniref:DMT family transporter n=1 Tax=Nitratireductor rhodophyticola TaxID=2854036 RepID=UPI000AEC481B|nr:DMT family transporter [Nitratireductor rhodophyticola]MEC9245005.1 DMT family transporter [Pseudomonadota bacterium]WPZ13378.1 DMT family transporter [Nitratireductor rhodophyticola]
MSSAVHRGVVVSFSPNARGALFMSIAMAGFTVNDGLTKLVAEAMNMAQVMLVRGVMATLVMLLLAWQWKALKKPRAVLHPMVALRVAGETGATICFLSALAHMPIANLAAVMQALPLAVTLGAAFFLNEPVGWRRWSAIIVGFVGILIIIRPGFDAFNAYSLYGVAAVAFATMRDLTTRKIPSEIPSPMISTVTAASVTIAGAVLLVPYGGWSPMSGADFAILVGATLCIVCGYHFIVLSLRAGELSFIAPFRYTALLWAIGLGIVLFADWPDRVMMTGAFLVVCSGLYTLYREQVVNRTKPAARSTGPGMATEGT